MSEPPQEVLDDPLIAFFDTSAMSAEEYEALLDELSDLIGERVTTRRIAYLLGRGEQQISKMKNKKQGLDGFPVDVRLLLRLIEGSLRRAQAQFYDVRRAEEYIDPDPPRRKGDWQGRYCLTRYGMLNGNGTVFPRRTLMRIERNYGGLTLERVETCWRCGSVHVSSISRVDESGVALLTEDFRPEVIYEGRPPDWPVVNHKTPEVLQA